MNIVNFLVAYWDSVLVIIVLAALLVFLILKGKKSVVDRIIFWAVTELERQYGPQTGSLKLAAAVDMVYPKLPAVIRTFITAEMLVKWIEDGLVSAKEIWAKNSALAEYVGTNQTVE